MDSLLSWVFIVRAHVRRPLPLCPLFSKHSTRVTSFIPQTLFEVILASLRITDVVLAKYKRQKPPRADDARQGPGGRKPSQGKV